MFNNGCYSLNCSPNCADNNSCVKKCSLYASLDCQFVLLLFHWKNAEHQVKSPAPKGVWAPSNPIWMGKIDVKRRLIATCGAVFLLEIASDEALMHKEFIQNRNSLTRSIHHFFFLRSLYLIFIFHVLRWITWR